MALEILTDAQSTSRWCEKQRAENRSIGFVPTMGALHAGHQSLIERSLAENEVTCVSIFVNPLQFNDPRDFDNYPDTLQSDYDLLRKLGCDMVFKGNSRDIFPEASSLDEVELLDPGPYALGLEGEYRPGHLEGVCTVVDRLFRIVGDCSSYFGLKDYQQLLVVQQIAQKLGCPQIVPCETVREHNGLACSSRNKNLSRNDLETAKHIYLALVEARNLWESGIQDCDQLRSMMQEVLDKAGLFVEYADIRDPSHWGQDSPKGKLDAAVALIAARVGEVRLIDNLRLDTSNTSPFG